MSVCLLYILINYFTYFKSVLHVGKSWGGWGGREKFPVTMFIFCNKYHADS